MAEKIDCIYFDACALKALTREDRIFLGMPGDGDCHCVICDQYDNLTHPINERRRGKARRIFADRRQNQ